MYSTEMIALRERNESRVAAAKAELGATWLLHPDNSKKRITKFKMKVRKTKVIKPVKKLKHKFI